MSDSPKAHWERVYETKPPTEVSWYQPVPARSLELIRATGEPLTAPVLDVGGGASTLVDHLLDEGYSDVTILDIAATALDHARARLGDVAARVNWVEADITCFRPTREYALWHDRAVFHFLTHPADRERYLAVLRSALRPKGHFVLATFGPEGPTRCSGLAVQRYSVHDVTALLGPGFELQTHQLESHRTPMGTVQQFLYGWWRAAAQQGAAADEPQRAPEPSPSAHSPRSVRANRRTAWARDRSASRPPEQQTLGHLERSAIAMAARDEGFLVPAHGESGVGKTTLLDDLTHFLPRHFTRTLTSQDKLKFDDLQSATLEFTRGYPSQRAAIPRTSAYIFAELKTSG